MRSVAFRAALLAVAVFALASFPGMVVAYVAVAGDYDRPEMVPSTTELRVRFAVVATLWLLITSAIAAIAVRRYLRRARLRDRA